MHLLLPKRLYFLLFFLCLLLGLSSSNFVKAAPCDVIVNPPADGKVNFCEGDPAITLTATLGENVVSYEWYKDGVQTGNTNSSSIAVSETGIYHVIARVNGCPDPIKMSNRIAITYSPQPVTPTFSTSPDAGAGNLCAGDEIVFNLQAPDATGNVVYEWNFDDGSPLVRTTGAETVVHPFQSAGTGIASFDVEVTAINQLTGCTSTYTETVRVLQTAEISFTEKNDFQVCLPDSVTPADTTITIALTNTTVAPYLTDIRTYFVDWGDGTEISYPGQPSPFPLESPRLDTLGSYPVKIRAVNLNNCETTFEQTFFYGQKPKANFTTGKEAVGTPQSCTPVIWAFGDSSSGAGLTYKWEIKDQMNIGGWQVQLGGSLAEDTLRVQFNNSGQFEVQLIVSNACGSDTTSQSIIVGYPQVQLSGGLTVCGDTTIKYDQTLVFFDPNFGNTVSYQWFVNGRQVSTEQYPELDFPRPGTYNVEARITNECGSSDDLGQQAPPQVITVLPIPGPPIINDVTTCAGDGALLAPTGPGTTYNFYDAGGNLVFTGAEFTTQPLTGPATFDVETIDQNNCPSDRVTVNVNVVPAIGNNTITGNQSICVGGTPSEITGLRPIGGIGSPVYSWLVSTTGPTSGFTRAAGVNTMQSYTPQSVGQTSWFRRVVSAGSTCTADTSAAVKITVVPLVENNTISADQEICANESPAILTGERPTGGDGVNYPIVWEVSTNGPEEGFVPAPGDNAGENYDPGVLTQTSWFRRVVESNGCRVESDPVKITVYDALDNNTISTETEEICTGTAPAPLTGREPTGGSGAYTYLWEVSTTGANTGFAAAPGTNTGRSYSPGRITRPTWFRRTVSSAACQSLPSNVIQIVVNPAVRNNTIVATQTSVCTGQAPTQIEGSTPADGAGGYTYLWESSTVGPNTGFVQAAGTNNDISYTPAALNRDTWFRRVVFSGGCSDTSEVVSITVLPIPAAPSLVARNATACVGGSATLAVANPDGLEYRWYTSSTGGTPVFIGAEYIVDNATQTTTYYVEAVNAGSECASSTRTPATVTVVTPAANAGEDVEIIQGRPAALVATGGVTYSWEPAEGLSNPNIANPVATPQETTTYTVTVTTAEGCVDTDEVTITVIPALRIPNAFTPNGDNFNQVWEIENFQNFPDMRVEVFNRWGNKVFSSKGYGTPWDGTYNGKLLPVATYYYLIYLDGTDNEPISGNVTIIR